MFDAFIREIVATRLRGYGEKGVIKVPHWHPVGTQLQCMRAEGMTIASIAVSTIDSSAMATTFLYVPSS